MPCEAWTISSRETPSADTRLLGAPLWDGRPGRVEVWYATFTDTTTGAGYWLHYETVAPNAERPDTAPYAHGWASVFPAGGAPRTERFGPDPIAETDAATWLAVGSSTIGPGRLAGSAGGLAWDLAFDDLSAPLFTFGRTVWQRHLLPGAQCVPWPSATFRGTFAVDSSVDGLHTRVEGRGAVARIYGHSNAHRWCWLHADLDDGAVLELVSATARRPALRGVPPLAMVALRLPGEADWPRVPLLVAPMLRTRIGQSGFTIAGRVGTRRLHVEVGIPAERGVALSYTDPDGSTATCTNSEVADATVVLHHRGQDRRWELTGRAHAEIGRRP